MAKVTIYHNSKCATSREALAIIRSRKIEPTIIEYLKTPLTKTELKALIAQMRVPVGDVIRWKEPLAAQLNLHEAKDEALIDAMAAHPILINRPIVVAEKGARLCRPAQKLVELL